MLFLLTCKIDGCIRRFVTQAADLEHALEKVQRLVGPDCIEGDIAITHLSDFLTDVAELPSMVTMVEIAEGVGDQGFHYLTQPGPRVPKFEELVEAAATAEDYYTPDELEAFAAELNRPPGLDEVDEILDLEAAEAAAYEKSTRPPEFEDGPSNVAGYDQGDLARRADLIEVPDEY